MGFKKGHQKLGGRGKGSENQLTKTVKDTVLAVFNKLQEDPKVSLYAWGKKNPGPFYQIAAKLIPTEISGGLKLLPPPVIELHGDPPKD